MASPNHVGSNGFSHQLGTVLLWFRRDLRVADNPALCAAVQAARYVVPVFLWAPEEEGQFQPGRCSRWWLYHSLQGFSQDLAALGCQLVVRRTTEARHALLRLVQETGAQALFFNHLYDPISLVRDNEVKALMATNHIYCQSFNGDVLYEPWEILGSGGLPFTNFEDYWSRVMSMPYPPPSLLPIPTGLVHLPQPIAGLELHDLQLMTAEEEQSNQQLFHSRMRSFSLDRAKTDRDSTSRLSPHVHFGEVSVRQVYYVVTQQVASTKDNLPQSSASDYLRQMGYREYARYLSFHFPFTHERSLLEHLRAVPWKYDQRLFKAWRQGRTGFPLVDAGMRQLWSTGWLHNRARVVCASFLVKHLLLPWQWGLKHFWDALLDADLECDALGWQYCSGCLNDAHPFGYMMDHREEAKRYDPEGNWVRRWLPVLARLPLKWIHRPWEAPQEVLSDAGVELGANYERPIVDEAEALQNLQAARAVVEQSLPWGTPPEAMPYRQASVAQHGPTFRPASEPPSNQPPLSRPQPRAESHAVRGPEELSGGAATTRDVRSSEEVVSNEPAVSASGVPGVSVQPLFTPTNATHQGPGSASQGFELEDTSARQYYEGDMSAQAPQMLSIPAPTT